MYVGKKRYQKQLISLAKRLLRSKEVTNKIWMKDFTSYKMRKVTKGEIMQKDAASLFM